MYLIDSDILIYSLKNNTVVRKRFEENASIPKATVTNKGDILAATASGTVGRVSLGSNNQILTVDSATSTGVKWADVETVPTIEANVALLLFALKPILVE